MKALGIFLFISIPALVHGAPLEAVSKSVRSVAETPVPDAVAKGPAASPEKRKAAVSSIEPEALEGFENNPPPIQQLIRNALALTRLNLTYTFGSADPKRGGMDCSGTIYYLLNNLGVAGVPRQSDQICGWVKEHAALHRISRADALTHAEFDALQPGDLLFWASTYRTGPRDIPVSHVMLYLGKLKSTGKHVVFGASDGRVYEGQRRTGVSVFDFALPKSTSPATFYGYGIVPGLGGTQTKHNEHVIAATPPAATSNTAETEEVRRAEVVSASHDRIQAAHPTPRRCAPLRSVGPLLPGDLGRSCASWPLVDRP